MGKRGLFAVFEGIDGSGTSTQVLKLIERLEGHNKYQDVMKTHEPWRSAELKRRLAEDRDAYSDARRCAELFIADRVAHSRELIEPTLERGAVVISDNYAMTTCAYQTAQGLPTPELIQMQLARGLVLPDITFFVDLPADVAMGRIQSRSANSEKFEHDEFLAKVARNYQSLAALSVSGHPLFGRVVRIDGTQPIEIVASNVWSEFVKVYNAHQA